MEPAATQDISDASFAESIQDVDDSPEEEEEIVVAKTENKAVWLLRLTCFVLLVAFAVTVCLLAYFQIQKEETQDFEESFAEVGSKLVSSFDTTMKYRFGSIEKFASDLTFHAINQVQDENKTNSWPLTTLPDFEYRAGETARLADVISIVVANKVETEDRSEWEAYTQETKGWMEDGIAYNQGVESVEDLNITILPIPEQIVRRNHTLRKFLPEVESGPYYVAWQSYPILPDYRANRNILAANGHTAAVKHIEATHDVVLPASFEFYNIPESEKIKRRDEFRGFLQFYDGVDYLADPAVNIYYPVFDDLYKKKEDRNIVAVLLVGIYWRSYFVDQLPEGVADLHLVLSNTCNQTYTYVVSGESADFLGVGDLHEAKYDSHAITYHLNEDHSEPGNSSSTICFYRLDIYPTVAYEESFKTNTPLVFTLALAASFLLTCCIFFLYDFCVERRQRLVLKSAQQSGALVKSLFPEDVRDRLYEEQDAKKRERLNPFEKESQDVNNDTSAIAKLHPECTLLFADLKGFTR